MIDIPQHLPGKLQADLVKALPRLLPSLTLTRAGARRRLGSAATSLAVDVVTPLGRKRRLCVDARMAAAPSRIREAARQLRSELAKPSSGYPVLASTFLSPRAREICREEGVGYLDLAGNCYLRFDDLYLEKVVEKNPFPRRGRPPSLFSPISSRIARALLEEPERAWTVSGLAQATGVSLGQASNVCRRLRDEEYVGTRRRRLRLTQPARLLDAWQTHAPPADAAWRACYSFEREPERLLGRVARIGRQRRGGAGRYAVTSFGAASLVAPFVRGVGTLQWYVDEESAIERWVRALDLRPAETGANVLLRVPHDSGVFYRARTVHGVTLVGNIQLYLDLSHDAGRGQEQAAFLRQQKLGF